MPHSPAPFKPFEGNTPDGDYVFCAIFDANDKTIASFSGTIKPNSTFCNKEELEGNLSLFLAAPELLKMVKQYSNLVDSGDVGYMPELSKQLCLLINKAENYAYEPSEG